MSNLKFIGHRGYGPTGNNDAGVLYPENTIIAFKHAIDTGADGIELDVFLSKDGLPIVIHDRRLDEHVIVKQIALVAGRSTSDFTFQELQQFDVGCGQRIPHLDEVFDLFAKYDKKLILNMDVKDPESVPAILKTIEKYNSDQFNHEIIISSFKWDILKNFRSKNPDIKLVPAIKTAILFGAENVSPVNYMPLTTKYQENFRKPVEELHQEINCYAFDCSITDYTNEMIDFAIDQKVGLQFSTGIERTDAKTTNYQVLQELQDSLDLGVPFIICKVDEPDLVKINLAKKYSFAS